MEIIKKIPTALKNMNVDPKLAPLLQNYIENLVLEAIKEARKMNGKEYDKFLKEI